MDDSDFDFSRSLNELKQTTDTNPLTTSDTVRPLDLTRSPYPNQNVKPYNAAYAPAGWKTYTTPVKVAIVIAVLVAVVGIALGITLPLVFKKKNPHGGNVAHKYKCLLVKGDYQCVVDDTNGTSKTNKCCGFRCGTKGCVFDETGKFNSPLACFTQCNQATTVYGCVNKQCQATTEGLPLYPNDPCCGSNPCVRLCTTFPSNSELKETHFQTLASPANVRNFGLQIGVVETSNDRSFRVFTSYYQENIVQNLNAFLHIDEIKYISTTQLNVSNVSAVSLSCLYNPGSPNVTVGQNGTGFAVTNVSRQGDINCQNPEITLYLDNDFQNAVNVVGQKESQRFVMAMSQTLPWAFLFDRRNGFLDAISQTNGSTVFPQSFRNEATTTQLCTATNSGKSVITVFAGSPTQNNITKLQFQPSGTVSGSWIGVENNILEKNLPATITALGSPLSCSQDQTVLLAGSNNELVLLSLNISTNKYQEHGLISVDGLNNTAVSSDGRVMAWTSSKLSYVQVALKKTDPGFHHTLTLSVPSTTGDPTMLGVGGLSVVKIDDTHYVICSASGNSVQNTSSGLVYMWIVEITSS